MNVMTVSGIGNINKTNKSQNQKVSFGMTFSPKLEEMLASDVFEAVRKEIKALRTTNPTADLDHDGYKFVLSVGRKQLETILTEGRKQMELQMDLTPENLKTVITSLAEPIKPPKDFSLPGNDPGPIRLQALAEELIG